jgi:polar amino acid transport system permease protein
MADSNWVGPTFDLVLPGAARTLELAALAVAISIVAGIYLGLLLCLPKGRYTSPIRWLLTGYLQLFRGLPVLVTLFIVFFLSPSAGVGLASFPAAVVALSLWGSANVMEVVRGAVRTIPSGQSEAAFALGFGWVATMRLVVFPQALKRVLAPTVNLTVDLIQATTLASLIGVIEVLQRSRQAIEYYELSSGNGHATAILSAVLLLFFAVCFPMTWLAGRLERRTGTGRTEKAQPREPSASGKRPEAETPVSS